MSRVTLALATALSLAVTSLAAQNLEKGVNAYYAGDYAQALKMLSPLADDGDYVQKGLRDSSGPL